MSVQTAVIAPRPAGEILSQQRRGAHLAPVLTQPDHLAMHDIREHGPKPLPFPRWISSSPMCRGCRFTRVRSQLARNAFSARRALPPADAVPHGCVTGRHRLTVHPDLLSQMPTDACLRIRELHALGAEAARPAEDPALWIDERHVMCRPGQVVPRAIPLRSDPSGASATSPARVPTDAPSLKSRPPSRPPAPTAVRAGGQVSRQLI